MSAIQAYFQSIFDAIRSTKKGMGLTWKHLMDARRSRSIQNIQDPAYFKESTGIFTSQYPHIEVPAPVNGRYQLHNEMDDCIVCDKCVKVCPVDCIDIEPIKATELVGHTSDGSPIRLYAAKFDIDMAKCCFCGLCTTVCPTECLTMTSEYDFSTFDITTHNFSFANLSPEEATEKKRLYEQFVAEKDALKAVNKSEVIEKPLADSEQKPKPAFKPSFKVKVDEVKPEENKVTEEVVKPKPAFKPSFKAKVAEVKPEENKVTEEPEKPKPVFKPSFKAKTPEAKPEENEVKEDVVKPKPIFKPSFKPKKPNTDSE